MRQDERDRVQQIMRQARSAGRDPIEVLDRANLILTEKQYHKIRNLAYHRLADDLENVSITEILRFYGSSGHTALDAQRVLTEWIRARARKEMDK